MKVKTYLIFFYVDLYECKYINPLVGFQFVIVGFYRFLCHYKVLFLFIPRVACGPLRFI